MILLILGHTLWTQDPRKSIKGSKNSDSSLVSNKNLSEILPFSGLDLGQVTWAKMATNLLHLWRHSQKTWNPKPTSFFIANSKTCRIFWGFEQLSGAIGGGVVELQSDSLLILLVALSQLKRELNWRSSA